MTPAPRQHASARHAWCASAPIARPTRRSPTSSPSSAAATRACSSTRRCRGPRSRHAASRNATRFAGSSTPTMRRRAAACARCFRRARNARADAAGAGRAHARDRRRGRDSGSGDARRGAAYDPRRAQGTDAVAALAAPAARRVLRAIARELADRRTALVLGAGGAKGFAHVGALRAFERHGVEFDAGRRSEHRCDRRGVGRDGVDGGDGRGALHGRREQPVEDALRPPRADRGLLSQQEEERADRPVLPTASASTR